MILFISWRLSLEIFEPFVEMHKIPPRWHMLLHPHNDKYLEITPPEANK